MSMFEELVSTLEREVSQGRVKFWRLQEISERQREYYILGEPNTSSGTSRPVLDQARTVSQSQLIVEVWVDKGESQGFASKTIFTFSDPKVQLEECIAQAQVSNERPWTPESPSKFYETNPSLCYSGLLEDFEGASEGVFKNLSEAIAATPKGIFNSAELFCGLIERQVQASNGHTGSSQRSRFYAEVCFSAQKDDDSQEYMSTAWAMHPDQLDFKRMCDESANYADALLSAEPVKQGEYSVLLHADVLNEVFHDLASHLDARNKYYQMPFKQAGEDLIKGFQGTRFSMKLDPAKDWSMGSLRDDGWGRSQPALILSSNNSVLASKCSVQMAQYLEMHPSTVGGCLEIEAKGKVFQDLLRPEGVLEILQFSGLFTSSVDLTFSSEIRLARLWKADGSYSYLKGGSLSGSVNDHFVSIEFEDEVTIHNKYDKAGSLSYCGPRRALIHKVSVTA